MTTKYPKRLIEVDLPIKRISAHARREKSIRHGHISTLHIWWARRPLAACRAVICAALWPDPADKLCPDSFRRAAEKELKKLADRFLTSSEGAQELLADLENALKDKNEAKRRRAEAERSHRIESWSRFRKLTEWTPNDIQQGLLELIAWCSGWEQSTMPIMLKTVRALTQAAHEALGGAPGSRPLVVDPFAGGGAIPLEALRVGADAFASDLNPVAVLLNKVVLEYIPKYGQRLADEVRKWGEWIKSEAEKELAEFYPKDVDGATPIAYLWARTIRCEGPGCGVQVPLIRNLWLGKKAIRSVALQLVPNVKAKRVDFRIIAKQRGGWVDQADPETKIQKPKFDGTVKSGSATCPCCGYTTQNARVRAQLAEAKGGAATARMTAVVVLDPSESGRSYRLPTNRDENAATAASRKLASVSEAHPDGLSPIPDEPIPKERPSPNARGLSAVTRMGVERFSDLFTPRQTLALVTLNSLVKKAASDLPEGEARAVRTVLALSVGKVADLANSCCRWEPVAECPRQLFARQAVPIVWDFPEGVPIGESSGSWEIMIERFGQFVATSGSDWNQCEPQLASATHHPLPDDSAAALFTDPPYYDAVPYGDLSDFFYVWLRRALDDEHCELFSTRVVEKDEEAIWNPSRIYSKTGKPKDELFYETQMARALAEGRRVTTPAGIGVVVFAHKSTAGWEAILSALINAGWIATASWPVDTEMGSRVNAMGTASLASSVHIVCRPRENPDGSMRTDEIGDWRDVLQELPRRIHEWMPRLAKEGVVGADALFACLGPALEIFSRYSRVEKADGSPVLLKDYLGEVWAAVAREALTMVFEGADVSGFEEDARLTAMWLWTISTGAMNGNGEDEETAESEGTKEEEESSLKPARLAGFVLEFDPANRLAMGIGAHLERMTSIVEIKGDKARLLPVAERFKDIFAKDESYATAKRKHRDAQMPLPGASNEEARKDADVLSSPRVPTPGETVLDRVHQSMILFAAGRGEALKRFLVDDGAGSDEKFWRLAQALVALYPKKTDERRWIEGVTGKKKGLGF